MDRLRLTASIVFDLRPITDDERSRFNVRPECTVAVWEQFTNTRMCWAENAEDARLHIVSMYHDEISAFDMYKFEEV